MCMAKGVCAGQVECGRCHEGTGLPYVLICKAKGFVQRKWSAAYVLRV